MTVQCRRSHHLVPVFETDVGPVVITHPGPHAHGSKDFADTGHHGDRGRADRLDLLDAGPGVGTASPPGAAADPSSCPARTSWPGWMPVSIG